jgi:hypothetical protein
MHYIFFYHVFVMRASDIPLHDIGIKTFSPAERLQPMYLHSRVSIACSVSNFEYVALVMKSSCYFRR